MTPTTAAGLLKALDLAGCPPRVLPNGITFDAPMPGHLVPAIEVLRTGVRAIVSGKKWFGCSSRTGWAEAIDPAKRIPSWCTMLAVEGGKKWDRIRFRPDALFDKDAKPARKTTKPELERERRAAA